MSYTALPHVATGDLATAALQNSLLDNVAFIVPGDAVNIHMFGGDPNAIITATAIVNGTAYASLVPGTDKYTQDAINLLGTMKLRGFLRSAGGGTVTYRLYNLTDSPNASPLATITSGSNDDGTVITSSAIVWPVTGADKVYGIKPLVSGAGIEGLGANLQIVRTA